MRWRALIDAAHPAQLGAGLVIWSLWFVALYAALSISCAAAPPEVERGALTWLNGGLMLLTLLVTLLLVWLACHCWRLAGKRRQRDQLIPWVGAAVHLFAAGATLAVGLPVAVLPPCL